MGISMTVSMIQFKRPIISDNKVRFEWDKCFIDEYFRDDMNFVSIEYHADVELNLSICYSQLMGMFFPIISGLCSNEVQVSFPDPVSKSETEAWLSFKNISNITVISKLTAANENSGSISHTGIEKIGLLYGGGKDSLAALKIFNELYPNYEKSMMRIHWSKQSIGRQKALFEREVIKPLKEDFDIEYLDCTNDIYRNMKSAKTAQLMGFSFYHASCLPFYLSNNFLYINFSIDSLDFPTSQNELHSGNSMHFLSARPEKSEIITGLLERRGSSSILRNISFGIPGYLHFEILMKGDKRYLKHIYMCENTYKRWCFNCRKCFSLAILSLKYGYNPETSGFDIIDFFKNSEYITNRINPDMDLIAHGQFSKLYSHSKHYAATCSVLNSIDQEQVRAQLTENEVELFNKLKHRFGDGADAKSMAIWKEAIRIESGKDFNLLMNYFESLNLEIIEDDVIHIQNDTLDVYDFTIYSD